MLRVWLILGIGLKLISGLELELFKSKKGHGPAPPASFWKVLLEVLSKENMCQAHLVCWTLSSALLEHVAWPRIQSPSAILSPLEEGWQRSQAMAGKDKTEEHGSGLGQGFPISRGWDSQYTDTSITHTHIYILYYTILHIYIWYDMCMNVKGMSRQSAKHLADPWRKVPRLAVTVHGLKLRQHCGWAKATSKAKASKTWSWDHRTPKDNGKKWAWLVVDHFNFSWW